jgi:hypothetical protein
VSRLNDVSVCADIVLVLSRLSFFLWQVFAGPDNTKNGSTLNDCPCLCRFDSANGSSIFEERVGRDKTMATGLLVAAYTGLPNSAMSLEVQWRRRIR